MIPFRDNVVVARRPLAPLVVGAATLAAWLAGGSSVWVPLLCLAAAALFVRALGARFTAPGTVALWLLGGALGAGIGALAGHASLAGALLAATAALCGAHLALFPRARTFTLALVPLHVTLVEVPSFAWLAGWLALALVAAPSAAAAAGIGCAVLFGGAVACLAGALPGAPQPSYR